MIFASYEFVYLFLPIVLIGYFLLNKLKNPMWQHLLLVAASFYFYGYFNPSYLIIIFSSIIINYVLGLLLSKKQNKLLLFLGIIFNIGLLIYFKYTDFFISNFNVIAGTNFRLLKILLPLGISFFTFQQFSFLISVYQKEEKVSSFLEYSLFVTFFPQLVAGPIVLYSEMMPQFLEKQRRYFNLQNFVSGIYIFALGLSKKIIIADTLSLIVDNGYGLTENINFISAWLITLSYTFQIYFDFSGYCDMAIGIGKMFNIDLPLNFNSPYKSKNITEFWKRWHMTLGRALATYVYIPLGGNRKGKSRTYINLMLTFLASGFWHGASWSFIIWGVMHGIFSVADRVFKNVQTKIPDWIRIGSTFLLVNFLWVFFRAENLEKVIKIFKGIINIRSIFAYSQALQLLSKGIETFNHPHFNIIMLFLMIVFCLYLVFFCKNTVEKAENVRFDMKNAIYIGILFFAATVCMWRVSPFIYFNF